MQSISVLSLFSHGKLYVILTMQIHHGCVERRQVLYHVDHTWHCSCEVVMWTSCHTTSCLSTICVPLISAALGKHTPSTPLMLTFLPSKQHIGLIWAGWSEESTTSGLLPRCLLVPDLTLSPWLVYHWSRWEDREPVNIAYDLRFVPSEIYDIETCTRHIHCTDNLRFTADISIRNNCHSLALWFKSYSQIAFSKWNLKNSISKTPFQMCWR